MSLIPSHGDSRGIGIIVVCIVFWIVAAFAVFLRIWSRRIQEVSITLNDYTIFLALILTTCLIANQFTAVLAGAEGQHMQNATVAQLTVLNKAFLAAEPLWSASNTAVKISILHLYITIFPKRQFHYICWTVMALTIGYFFVVLLESFLLCRPVQYNWDKTIEGTCADTSSAFLSAAIINLLIDVCTIVLPLPMLWKLHLPTAKKIGIIAMFSLGAVILIITILRIVSVRQLDPSDLTYTVAPVGYFTDLEPLLGILNACLPVILPALRRIFKRNGERRGSTIHNETYISTISALRSNCSRTKRFHRLNDNMLPLSDMMRRTDEISGEQSSSHKPEGQAPTQSAPDNGIQVTRAWDVLSISDVNAV